MPYWLSARLYGTMSVDGSGLLSCGVSSSSLKGLSFLTSEFLIMNALMSFETEKVSCQTTLMVVSQSPVVTKRVARDTYYCWSCM
jgi:hypothetical protein